MAPPRKQFCLRGHDTGVTGRRRKACRECEREKSLTPTVKAQQRAYRLDRFFRITPEEFDKIEAFMAADPVYSRLLSRTGTRNAVEHRHKDGLIRGVMAPMLNRAFGVVEQLYGEETGLVLSALAAFFDYPPASVALSEDRYGIIGKAQNKKVMKYGPPQDSDRGQKLFPQTSARKEEFDIPRGVDETEA